MERIIVVAVLALGGLWFARLALRRKRRRASLYQDDSGNWYWIDFDGTECKSTQNPDAPGGEWHNSGGSDTDGGDEGDGGGD